MLTLYNVRTRSKEPFVPADPKRVGIYVCGLTVYDHAHIGHARTAVSFEVARRWLEHRFGAHHVRFVQNVTDVDDKIIKRAQEQSVSPREHAAKWDAECVRQMRRLGVRDPDEAPHVTTSVPGIITFIQGIVANGFAYATPEGNVYFDVPRYQAHAQVAFPGCGYGSLSNRDYLEMESGTRKEVEADKRHPADFALWKAGEPGSHADADWESPWGRGRPGWHIECSLMATRSLGETIDLHGGGQDLLFPHHENEVAQSQAKTGKAPFVRTWVHTGFLNVEGEKMSKSLGNYITLAQALDELAAKGHTAEALRLYYVQTHYRSKIDYSHHGLAEATAVLEKLQRTRRYLHDAANASTTPVNSSSPSSPELSAALIQATTRFEQAMDDDLHTPGALAILFGLQRTLNTALDSGLQPAAARGALEIYEKLGTALTLFDSPIQQIQTGLPAALRELAGTLGIALDGAHDEAAAMPLVLAARADARKAKQWARSDAIRDAAKAAGYAIEDTPAGQRWSRD